MKCVPQLRKQPKQARSEYLVETILEAAGRVLGERGYAATTTNLVAARAGVSVGSLYQYFPNKDSLVAALHERHARQMDVAIDRALLATERQSLPPRIAAVVRAMLLAHQDSPQLHRVLEQEFPFFDAPADQSPADQCILKKILGLLGDYSEQLSPHSLDLAAWIIMTVTGSLVHAAVIDPPAGFTLSTIEAAITRVVLGFLTYADDPAEVD
ncbi:MULTISPECIES: TetR/AcrR family transcriptional regulator [unclassified Caballeronia]|uniref:TetR/AcrR family transcriptional regulator n=1 Tax=unclassified Caballeronia TaxID=2646786 RepID=UPI0028642D0F|nr:MULTISPECIES: TetR/AcrR family transcriptional regulator [unclassified Caballeronia]MDR5752624.1 TetR/AcrR family transcriptional regulator [Caballeronia sp. LZ024]MDR5841617.1 TetR/AcrR family transcriptional regulator [Caballeronia sp. LZ031]